VVVFTIILLVAAALLVYRAGSVSWTWDEQNDMQIVACLERSHDPFACLDDITQTRLPFYIHAAVALLAPWDAAHYVISAVFALANVVLVFVLARSRFGSRTALLAMALVATAPAVLASGRMLLSHSNVILTTFTLATVTAYDRFDRTADVRFFLLSAAALGLAVASSVLGLFTVLVIAAYWLSNPQRRRPWQPMAYGAVTTAVFLASTLIYLRPTNLATFVAAAFDAKAFPEWNYLQLGTNQAPRWYSLLLFAVSTGPWWSAVFAVAPVVLRRSAVGEGATRCARAIWAAFLAYLVLKSGVFRYDAPHQQVAWYPLVFVVVAATATELIRRTGRVRVVGLVALVAFGALQLYETHRFFPNYLFHGAQYGSRFIGEFYGPAVFHAQDRDAIDRQLDAIVAADPGVRILTADNNAFQRTDEHFVAFTRRDPSQTYQFAVVDRLYATHFRFPERDEYNAFLARHYTVVRFHDFPTQKWAYRILRVRPVS
jgi:4-amino-4-deoxy-L-arabinose transferase-like glycosyltransferase